MRGGARWAPLIGVAMGVCWLVASCQLPGRPNPAKAPIRPQQITSFDALYAENCAGCHGTNGHFGAALPMNNPVLLALLDDTTLRQAIAQGVPGTSMPGFSQAAGGYLTQTQINIVATGMRRRWGSGRVPGIPSHTGSTGDASQGQKDFQTYCASCHGADGQGGVVSGSVVTGAYLQLVSNQHLRDLIIAGRPDLGHPDWRGYVPGHPLSAQEVDDLVAWLASRRPQMVGDYYAGSR